MAKAANEVHCFFCGTIIKKTDSVCSTCGKNQGDRSTTAEAEVYCAYCGTFISKNEQTCPSCGSSQTVELAPPVKPAATVEPKPTIDPSTTKKKPSALRSTIISIIVGLIVFFILQFFFE